MREESRMSVTVVGTDPECVETLEQVAELYASQAVRVRRLVHLRLAAPDAVVEDACQIAWLRLVRNRSRVRRQTAARWLVQVAVREALRLLDARGRELPLDELEDPLGRAPDLIEELAEHQSRMGAIERL